MASGSLLDLPYDALLERLGDLPAYRTEQVWHAVYRDLIDSHESITTLPRAVRARLTSDVPFPTLDPIAETRSRDQRTTKSLFRLRDGETIESVTMEYADRCTACVSSQVGCSIGCPFCATGQSGFVRDLAIGEIVAQVLHAARRLREKGKTLSHVVYMGMGEPFLNYHATLDSIRILNDPRGFSLGARSFTLSTAGIVPGIDRLADEGLQVNLAISLHASSDRARERLVPVNRRYPIASLLAACRRYTEATHRRVTFEIALIDGVNDDVEEARAVARLLRGLLCHVNLIRCNATGDSSLRPTPERRVQAFAEVLSDARIPVTIRQSMGTDIQAGCGQLRAREARSESASKPAAPGTFSPSASHDRT
jgi:23S rRNA (adenine2503-C2)-methyltransferase